ncbi:hypothetical protein SAMN04487939_105299 [Lysobacter sp. yr284]|uniref:hypothetical protein n=1 Tax=Lysobacter sp. yr284 TaxID=1761791 RepID=UPI0008949552|nr:hypothetical protein [Lysobacter sp. yr284]SDY74346.1 hypothetical protein SAMN04487939_105299 [Lysobacter sp. yr284]
MTDARDDDAERMQRRDGERVPRGADATSPPLALAALQRSLREATVALGARALMQQGEAALRADAVLAHGVRRLKAHLSAAGDGPHVPEATMSENTDHDDTAATPNASAGAHAGANGSAPPAPGDDADPAQPEPEELLERLRAALAGGEPYRYGGISQQIESALKQSNEAVLGAAGEFAYGHRAATDAFASGLRKVSDAQHRQNLQTLQAAALAVCLDAMLKQPEQAEEYAGLLEAIKHIV